MAGSHKMPQNNKHEEKKEKDRTGNTATEHTANVKRKMRKDTDCNFKCGKYDKEKP